MTGSRERKRAERHKRKQRTAEREQQDGEPSRSELKDRAAREALEPLAEGERPTAVTVGAAVAAVIAAVFWGSAVVALLTDTEVGGSEPQVAPLVWNCGFGFCGA